MTPPLHPSNDTKNGKEERNDSFREMILWNNVRRLVFKMVELERIDAPARPLAILAFPEAVPTVVLRGMIGASEKNALE